MHGSRLDDEQIRVPLLLRLPGQPPGRLPSPTFHQDVLPTLLVSFGGAAFSGPGTGRDLLRQAGRRGLAVVASSGVIEPEGYALIRGDDRFLFQLGPKAALPLAARGRWGPEDVAQALGVTYGAATALLAAP